MAPGPSPVMAAPNRSEIKAKIITVEQSPQFPDKWLLRLEVIDARVISGGLFARVGQNIQAFTFQMPAGLGANQIITAEAEFLGDAAGGQFQLTNLKKADGAA